MRKTQQGFAVSPGAPRASIPSSRLAVLADGWLLACDINRHSERTTLERRGLMEKLSWFLEARGLAECDTAALRQFLHHVSNGHREPGGRWGNPRMTHPTKPRTVKNYHNILRTFFNFLVDEGELDVSPLDKVPTPIDRPDQVQPFTEAQVGALLAAAKKTLHPLRDEAICLLLLDTGLRASELCQLTVADVDLSAGQIVVREGKGGKARVLPFSRTTKRALWNHLKERGVEAERREPLFQSDRGNGAGEALTRHGLRFLIRRLGQSARIGDAARCSPHTFRHTFAVMFLRAGGNVFTCQNLLGHTHLAMTQRYVSIASADVASQHQRFSPVERLKGGQK